MSLTLTFHESQYPAQVAAQVLHGLRTRCLPGRLLYDSPAQAQRWLVYHQAYSPSRTQATLVALYRQAYYAVLQARPHSHLHYISLGCGGGNKDLLLLQQALPLCTTVHFTPLDTSAALVLETLLRVAQECPTLRSAPLVADLSMEPDLRPFFEPYETSDTWRLLTCFGMLPNFDYRTFLPYVRQLMRPNDMLLLSANLSPGPYAEAVERIVPQYDNPLAHAWYAGLLDSLGFAAAQMRVHVRTLPLQPDGHIWRLQAEAEIIQPFTLSLYDEDFTFRVGERLQVFFSIRFSPQVMPQLLDAAGLQVAQTWLLDSHEEAIYWCTASA